MPLSDFSYFYPLTIFPSFLILALCIYTLQKNPSDTAFRIFAYFCAALFINGITSVFYRTGLNAVNAKQWDFFYTSAFYLSIALLLHFCLVFHRKKALLSPWTYALIYLPLPILIYFEAGTRLVNLKDVRLVHGHFYAIAGPLEPIRYIFMIAYPLASIYFLFRSWRENSDLQIKQQSLLLMASLFFPLVIGSLTDEILPLLGINVGSFLMFSFLFMACFMFIAITHFGFAKISPAAAVETTVSSIPEAIISTDMLSRVNYCNDFSIGLFKESLVNKKISRYSAEDRLAKEAAAFLSGEREIDRFEIRLNRTNGSSFPVDITLSRLREERGSTVSLLWDIRDLTDDAQLRASLEIKRTELESKINELRRLNEFMSGRHERLEELRGELAYLRKRLEGLSRDRDQKT